MIHYRHKETEYIIKNNDMHNSTECSTIPRQLREMENKFSATWQPCTGLVIAKTCQDSLLSEVRRRPITQDILTASDVMMSSLYCRHTRGSRLFWKINWAHQGGLTSVNPASAVLGWIISHFCMHFFSLGLVACEHAVIIPVEVFVLCCLKMGDISLPSLCLVWSSK